MTSSIIVTQDSVTAQVASAQGIVRICDRIEAGYAAERSALDDEMVPHVIALADCAADIKAMANSVESLIVQLQAALAALEISGAEVSKGRAALAAVLPYAHSRAEDLHDDGGDASEEWKKADAAISSAYALLAS